MLPGLMMRQLNYTRESAALLGKLENPAIDPSKKRRCQERLHDVQSRLMPATAEEIARRGMSAPPYECAL